MVGEMGTDGPQQNCGKKEAAKSRTLETSLTVIRAEEWDLLTFLVARDAFCCCNDPG